MTARELRSHAAVTLLAAMVNADPEDDRRKQVAESVAMADMLVERLIAVRPPWAGQGVDR